MFPYGLSWLTALRVQASTTKEVMIMPKMKTKKAAAKRLKMSATGKVLRTQGGKSHLNSHKPRYRKRNLRGTVVAKDVFTKTAERMLQGN